MYNLSLKMMKKHCHDRQIMQRVLNNGKDTAYTFLTRRKGGRGNVPTKTQVFKNGVEVFDCKEVGFKNALKYVAKHI